MSHALRPADPQTDAERALLEAAVAEARNDPRPAVAHEVVRVQLLAEIERLNRKAAQR
jgi:hypothetical protein